MRALYDLIEVNVRSLQSLGVSAEMYGSLLSPDPSFDGKDSQ